MAATTADPFVTNGKPAEPAATDSADSGARQGSHFHEPGTVSGQNQHGRAEKSPASGDNVRETRRPSSSSAATPGGDDGRLGDRPLERGTKRRSGSDNIQRLSVAEMQELASSPESLPIAPAPPHRRSVDRDLLMRSPALRGSISQPMMPPQYELESDLDAGRRQFSAAAKPIRLEDWPGRGVGNAAWSGFRHQSRAKSVSSPPFSQSPYRDLSPPSPSQGSLPRPLAIDTSDAGTRCLNGSAASPAAGTPPTVSPCGHGLGPSPPSPIPAVIPVPPRSLSTHLQLELAAQRPSPLYIHNSRFNDPPYEPYAVKLERLKNVLLLPPFLERTLYFGALACLDAWLYTFTILPIRFILSLALVCQWCIHVVGKEAVYAVRYVWNGLRRRRHGSRAEPSAGGLADAAARGRSPSRDGSTSGLADASPRSGSNSGSTSGRPRGREPRWRGAEPRTEASSRRPKSPCPPRDPGPRTGTIGQPKGRAAPSKLTIFHKTDLLQGAVILCSSLALMTLDASRMYHFIRAQSAIKLYVIYNILEVGDRLLSALGQDVFECLFSPELLAAGAPSRGALFPPLALFLLALVYNCLHSTVLYYQVITLNVAVNSYSNALLTLLLSNQFVEIKGTVFKRFDKENLFQLTCADIVERFHLWIMLFIIGMRNLVEVGGLSVPGTGIDMSHEDGSGPVPLHSPSILPHSFTVLPSWLISGEVLSPFLIVVGSEMLVDMIKHAYVTKFNKIKPRFYSRTLDILCKDYYTTAFTTPSLTRRLGLAVMPLSCLFIRASIQTYNMFLSAHIQMPVPPSTQTSLADASAAAAATPPSSSLIAAALGRLYALVADSLRRATFGHPYGPPPGTRPWYAWTGDDLVAALTMVLVFFTLFLLLLILKLLLGLALLTYARHRYARMKTKEQLVARGRAPPESYDAPGRRTGARAEVEVGDDRRRWIHADDAEGLSPPAPAPAPKPRPPDDAFHGVYRYEMVAKRIW